EIDIGKQITCPYIRTAHRFLLLFQQHRNQIRAPMSVQRPSFFSSLLGRLQRQSQRAFWASAAPEVSTLELAGWGWARQTLMERRALSRWQRESMIRAARSIGAVRTRRIGREWLWRLLPANLGGRDPYSASKAGAEMVAHAYRESFFGPQADGTHRIAMANARAGNVIGGGDWTPYQLIPDTVQAMIKGQQ